MDGSTPPIADTTSPRLNRRQLAKAATRTRVLQAGHLLFNEVGYEAATIRAIAARAGMSTGAVFASFEDKAALYVAIYGHPPMTPEQGKALRRAAYQVWAVRPVNWDDEDDAPAREAWTALRDVLTAMGEIP